MDENLGKAARREGPNFAYKRNVLKNRLRTKCFHLLFYNV